MKEKSVLLIDGYARQVLPMAKAFKTLNCKVTICCFSRLDVGYNTRYCDKRILFCSQKTDLEGQSKEVYSLLKSYKYDVVVPMTDYSATYLANNKKIYSDFAYIAVNDNDTFEYAINKKKTMKVCYENKIPCPKTILDDKSINEIELSSLEFPIVIKPQTACGSIGFNIINTKEQWSQYIAEYKGENGELFIQDFIPQGNNSQYGIEAFRTSNGEYASIVVNEKPRWFPIDGGSPTINISIHNEQMTDMAKKLLDTLDWDGYANIDFVMDARDDTPKLIEINGRISAAVKLNFILGVDIAKLILQNAFENKITIYDDYCDNCSISCFLTEILWFIKSSNKWGNLREILSKRNNYDVIFSLDDSLPFFPFCVQSLMKYKKEMKKRKRME